MYFLSCDQLKLLQISVGQNKLYLGIISSSSLSGNLDLASKFAVFLLVSQIVLLLLDLRIPEVLLPIFFMLFSSILFQPQK